MLHAKLKPVNHYSKMNNNWGLQMKNCLQMSKTGLARNYYLVKMFVCNCENGAPGCIQKKAYIH